MARLITKVTSIASNAVEPGYRFRENDMGHEPFSLAGLDIDSVSTESIVKQQ